MKGKTLTYTLTGYIFESIVVERDNIIIDGSGYTVLGAGTGIDMSERSNVTIKNLEIITFETGIYLRGSYSRKSSNNTIIGCSLRDNTWGIRLESYSNNNSIVNNLINEGISISDSLNNSILSNTLTDSGISLLSSSKNIIKANNGTNISLHYSNYNYIVSNGSGIRLTYYSEGNVLVNNTALNNTDGIFFMHQEIILSIITIS